MKRRLPTLLALVPLGLMIAGAAPGNARAQEGAQRCGTLPAPVAETRAAILAAADGGVDALAALADSPDFTSNYGGEDTRVFWQSLADEGYEVGATAKALLALGCTVEPDDDQVYYTWPAAADLPYGDLTGDERAAIGALNGGDIEDVYVEGTEVGYYVGWRLMITADGQWIALLAGD